MTHRAWAWGFCMGGLALAGAVLLVQEEAPARAAPPPPARTDGAPLAHRPAAAAPSAPRPRPAPMTEAELDEWEAEQMRPGPPVTDPAALVELACRRELSQLRPRPYGSDQDNLEMIQVRREWAALRARLVFPTGDPRAQAVAAESAPPAVRCPEQRLREMYERDRSRGLQIREGMERWRAQQPRDRR